MAITFTNYDRGDREGWLALREKFQKKGVGGSEIASIAGVPGAFGSAFGAWARRTGRMDARVPDNAYFRDGRDIEDIVAQRFEEDTGLKIRHRYAIITNDRYPHLFANVDGFIDKFDAGWECKTYDVRSDKFKDGCPPAYVSQVAVYMAVTEKRRWVLSAWAYGQGVKHFYFTLDPTDEKPEWAAEMVVLTQAELDAAEAIAADFIAHVESDTPPPVDGSEDAGEALRVVYPEENAGESMDLSAFQANLDAIAALDLQIKDLERQKEEQRQIVMEAMGTAESGEAGDWRVTFKTVETKRLDSKAAKEGLGESALDPYYKTTSARTFRVAKKKNK